MNLYEQQWRSRPGELRSLGHIDRSGCGLIESGRMPCRPGARVGELDLRGGADRSDRLPLTATPARPGGPQGGQGPRKARLLSSGRTCNIEQPGSVVLLVAPFPASGRGSSAPRSRSRTYTFLRCRRDTVRSDRCRDTFRQAPPFSSYPAGRRKSGAGSPENCRRCNPGNISSCRRIIGTMTARPKFGEFRVIHLESLPAFRRASCPAGPLGTVRGCSRVG